MNRTLKADNPIIDGVTADGEFPFFFGNVYP
jgi:hypothetical protein